MQDRQDRQANRVDSIESLRGISALLVLLYHYRLFLNDIAPNLGHTLFENGRIGVDIFFVISGFAIYLSTVKYKERVVARFLVRRFFRIVPLAWLLMALVYWLTPNMQWEALLKSLFFIPLGTVDPPFFGYNILTPAWTLTYELCFYALFAVALAIVPNYRGIGVTVLVCGMILFLQWVAGTFTLNAYDKSTFESLYIGSFWVGLLASPLFLEFLCGVFLAFVYLNYTDIFLRVPVRLRVAIYLFLFSFFISHFFSGSISGHGLDRKGLAAVAIFVFFLCAHADPVLDWFRDRFIPGPGGVFLFLGKISFSLYVVHEFIHQFIYRIPVIYPIYDQTGGLGKFVTLSFFSILFAYLLYVLVELPTHNLGRRIAARL